MWTVPSNYPDVRTVAFLPCASLMTNILKFPGKAPRLDHKRSTRRRVDPDQLDLFASIPGRIADLPLNPFDEALLQEERG